MREMWKRKRDRRIEGTSFWLDPAITRVKCLEMEGCGVGEWLGGGGAGQGDL